MGLYDRDYVRDEPQGFFLGGDRTMVVNLILVNVGIFLVDVVFFSPEDQLSPHQLSQWMAVKADLFKQPWNCWQLLTAGFAHDPHNIMHVGFNMFGLWMFGRDIEMIYGKREFLRIYLTMIIVSSLTWVISANIMTNGGYSMLGASGAVNGLMVLFVLHYPRRLLFFGIPAWLLCMVLIATDVLGFNRQWQGERRDVAYAAHLAGAAFAYVYYKTGWNLGRWLPSFRSWKTFSWKGLKPRPKLRIHKPAAREQDLGQEVDRILEKISAQGESSLTAAERRTLEEASRRYQQKRR